MAERMDAGAEKKGFFARRRERKQARKAARQSPPHHAAAAPLKPSALPARPGAVPPRPAPPPPRSEVRYSLESLPEVEKRIDRMAATERRQKLLERYEQRYGEKLDVPKVFVSIEDEKQAEAAGAADRMAGGAIAINEDKLAAVTGMAPPKAAAPPPKAAAPPPKAPAPARTGLFGARPAPPASAGPGAPAPARPAAPAPARPAAPVAAAPVPAAPAPSLPEGMTLGKYLFPQLWPFWGLPLYKYAKFRWPDKRNMQMVFAVLDIPLLIILFLPRLFGLFWIGLALMLIRKQKQKKAKAAEAAAMEEAPAATN